MAKYLVNIPMNCIFWNCHVSTSVNFLISLFDLLQTLEPSILALVETKVQSTPAQIILQKSYLNKLVVSEAYGFFGGIWLFWDNYNIDLELINLHKQIITGSIKREIG